MDRLRRVTGAGLAALCLLWPVAAGVAEPIHEACGAGDLARARALLLDNPRLLLAKDDRLGATPLHWAAAGGHGALVKYLVGLRAPLETRNKAGWTPLHEAARRGDSAVVQTLLEAGADAVARSPQGESPRQLAEAAHNQAVAPLTAAEEDLFVWAQGATTPAGALWLESLRPTQAGVGWGESRRTAPTLGRRQFTHGLFAHADSTVAWSLPAGAKRVVLAVGLANDGEVHPQASARFAIEVDGQVVARTGVLRGGDPPQLLQADLRGKRQLVLRADDAGDGNAYDWATYGGGLLFVGPQEPAAWLPAEPPEVRADAVRGAPSTWRVLWIIHPATKAHLAFDDGQRVDVEATLGDEDVAGIRAVLQRWPAKIAEWSAGRLAIDSEVTVWNEPLVNWCVYSGKSHTATNRDHDQLLTRRPDLRPYDVVGHICCSGTAENPVPLPVWGSGGHGDIDVYTRCGERWNSHHLEVLTHEFTHNLEIQASPVALYGFDEFHAQQHYLAKFDCALWAPRVLGGLPMQRGGWEFWGLTASVIAAGTCKQQPPVLPPQLRAPLSGTIWDRPPRLQWRAVPADSYRVRLWQSGRAEPVWVHETTELHAEPPAERLRPGERYVWQVTALRLGQASPPGDVAWFACGPVSPPRVLDIQLPAAAPSDAASLPFTATLVTPNAIRAAWAEVAMPDQPGQRLALEPVTPLLHETRWTTELVLPPRPAAAARTAEVVFHAVDCTGREAPEWRGSFTVPPGSRHAGASATIEPQPLPAQALPAAGGELLLSAKVQPRDTGLVWVTARAADGEERLAPLRRQPWTWMRPARLWLPPNTGVAGRRWQLTWHTMQPDGSVLDRPGDSIEVASATGGWLATVYHGLAFAGPCQRWTVTNLEAAGAGPDGEGLPRAHALVLESVLRPKVSGQYVMQFESHGVAELWLAGRRIAWMTRPPRESTKTTESQCAVDLEAGRDYPVCVVRAHGGRLLANYWPPDPLPRLAWRWRREGGQWEPVPSDVLTPRPVADPPRPLAVHLPAVGSSVALDALAEALGVDRCRGREQLAGQVVTQGVSSVGDRVLSVDTGGRAARFEATVGQDGHGYLDWAGLGSVRCEVWADGRRVAESPTMQTGDKPYRLAAELKGARWVVLVAASTGLNSVYDHAVWADARFICP